MPTVDVYIAAIPEAFELEELYPRARQYEVDAVTNPKVKAEKWCVWKLLEYALWHSFGFKMRQMEFTKTDYGKWTTPKCVFSLSHCEGIVAVAVSEEAVGVDIESTRSLMHERFADKILNAEERNLYEQTPENEHVRFLIERWTAKESLFKCNGTGAAFVPSEYDTLSDEAHIQTVNIGERQYILSVATKKPGAIRLYDNVDLLGKL